MLSGTARPLALRLGLGKSTIRCRWAFPVMGAYSPDYHCLVSSQALLPYWYPFSAQLRDLPLHTRTYLGEGQAEFLRTAPAHRCTFDGERVACILREDTTLQLCSHGDGHETRDATAPGGEVSQLSFTGHPLTL